MSRTYYFVLIKIGFSLFLLDFPICLRQTSFVLFSLGPLVPKAHEVPGCRWFPLLSVLHCLLGYFQCQSVVCHHFVCYTSLRFFGPSRASFTPVDSTAPSGVFDVWRSVVSLVTSCSWFSSTSLMDSVSWVTLPISHRHSGFFLRQFLQLWAGSLTLCTNLLSLVLRHA